LKTGSAISGFKYGPEHLPDTVYNVNIVPFQRPPPDFRPLSSDAEDKTQKPAQLQRLETKPTNFSAWCKKPWPTDPRMQLFWFNAMVHLSTQSKLLAGKLKRPEFAASLSTAGSR